MRPIYASNRINLSGWYAYKQPAGHPAIWDGGANRLGERTGLWCPITGAVIRRSNEWLNKLPNMPLDGTLEGDVLHVTSFPHVELLLGTIGRTTDNPVMYMANDNGGSIAFYQEAMEAMALLDGETCKFVNCTILPDDQEASLFEFRLMGADAMCRHPYSSWCVARSPYYATNAAPKPVSGRVRTISIGSSGDIESIEAWVGVDHTINFVPLYFGDQIPDAFFRQKQEIKLYILDNIVIGYE